MHIYSCGNCGGTLSGPDVYRCPYCGVLLRGTHEVTEDEYLRRQRERRRIEAAEQRQKIRASLTNVGGVVLLIVIALLVSALFIGGGAALGWFVLPLLFGYEARIPLLVSGMIVGGASLYPIILIAQWNIERGAKFGLRVHGVSRKPEWAERIEEDAEKKVYSYRLRSAWLLIFFLIISLPLLGAMGWSYPRYILLAIIFGVLLLLYFWAKQHKFDVGFTNFFIIALMLLYGLSTVGEMGLSSLSVAVVQHTGAFGGMLGGGLLAFYLAKRFAGPPPNRWELEHHAIRGAVFANPELLRDLSSETRQRIADELRTLLDASPQAWEIFSPAMRKAFPELEPKPSSQKAEGRTSKKSGGKK